MYSLMNTRTVILLKYDFLVGISLNSWTLKKKHKDWFLLSSSGTLSNWDIILMRLIVSIVSCIAHLFRGIHSSNLDNDLGQISFHTPTYFAMVSISIKTCYAQLEQNIKMVHYSVTARCSLSIYIRIRTETCYQITQKSIRGINRGEFRPHPRLAQDRIYLTCV